MFDIPVLIYPVVFKGGADVDLIDTLLCFLTFTSPLKILYATFSNIMISNLQFDCITQQAVSLMHKTKQFLQRVAMY